MTRRDRRRGRRWGRRPFRALAIGAAIGGCLLACGAPESDPVMDRLLAIADARAARAVAEMLEAYGGYPTWKRLGNVEYTYHLRIFGGGATPQAEARQLHRLGLLDEVQVYVEDLDSTAPQVLRLDGGEVAVTRGGMPVNDPDLLDFPRAFSRIIRWTFRAPWTLLDRHSLLEARASRTPDSHGPVPVGPCDVVRLRFTEETEGGTVEDWHDFYISQRSRLLERIHSYRAEDQSYRLTIWSDHRTIDGVRVPSRRETYASDLNGAIGALEAVAEYDAVRFNAPFDPGIFRAPVSIAAPGGPDAIGR
jgi:hypothetical protein